MLKKLAMGHHVRMKVGMIHDTSVYSVTAPEWAIVGSHLTGSLRRHVDGAAG
jgi:hypothetical protein